MEKIQDFLETKKKYEATLWDDQIGFFLLTVIFLGIQILNSRKVFAVCVIIEICLLILCSRMERKKYGSVFCSFVHGEIWGMIFFADGWGFIGMMRKPNNYLIIGIMGTILIALCYHCYIENMWKTNRFKNGRYRFIMRHVQLWLCCFFQLQFFHLCGLMLV